MIESAGKCRKRYVDNPKDRSKIIGLTHGPERSSDECEVLGDFGYKYSRIRPTKDRIQEPATKNKIGIQQDDNATV